MRCDGVDGLAGLDPVGVDVVEELLDNIGEFNQFFCPPDFTGVGFLLMHLSLCVFIIKFIPTRHIFFTIWAFYNKSKLELIEIKSKK